MDTAEVTSAGPRLGSLTPPLTGLAARQTEFASILARGRAKTGGTDDERRAAAREGAEEFVAMSLVQPLLKQLRDTGNAAAPFKPSNGELQFRSMLDAQISQRIVKAANFPLVDVVARGLMRESDGKGATK